jgi:polar amino acid transport system substrate-binding protein
MIMRTVVFWLVLAWLVHPGLAGAEVLRIATEGAYPPFSGYDSSGRLVGFDVDIASALCRHLDRECAIQAVAWEELIPGLVAGNYDAIVASMGRTEERDRLVDFTDHYYRSLAGFAGPVGFDRDISPEGLAGLRLGTAVGTVQADYVHRVFAHGPEIVELEHTDALYNALAEGEVDLIICENLSVLDFLMSSRGQRFELVGDPIPAEEISSESRIAVREGDDELREVINAALRDIYLSGEYARINRAYFPFSIY